MNTLITKEYFNTLSYFITASYKNIYFLVNIANLQDACTRNISNCLIATLERGVKVVGIVNTKAKRSIQSWNSRQFGMTLEKKGATIYYPKSTICMHAKAFCFDQKSLVLGSHNLSASADRKNIEISILTTDSPTISRFIEHFNKLTERCIQNSHESH